MQRQLEDCRGLADRLGWEVVAELDDNDLSAYYGKRRPGFEALLDAMKNGTVERRHLLAHRPAISVDERPGAAHRHRRRAKGFD